MNNSKYYPLALEALVELAPEIAAARSEAKPLRLNLDDVLDSLGTLPSGAMFLGMADDGLPVLLDLFDSLPGSLLLIGDQGSGKTTFLKTLASAIARTYPSEEVQFSVTTYEPEDWEEMADLSNCAGVSPISSNDAGEIITSLYDWAHQNDRSQQVVLLLLDGFDKTIQWDETIKSKLRWLLMRGPSRRIWPILTLNSTMVGDVKEWLSLFRTFIYGTISNRSLADMLTSASNAGLDTLRAGSEFSMREGNHWLRFWIPELR